VGYEPEIIMEDPFVVAVMPPDPTIVEIGPETTTVLLEKPTETPPAPEMVSAVIPCDIDEVSPVVFPKAENPIDVALAAPTIEIEFEVPDRVRLAPPSKTSVGDGMIVETPAVFPPSWMAWIRSSARATIETMHADVAEIAEPLLELKVTFRVNVVPDVE
jgi:hypothetical protein